MAPSKDSLDALAQKAAKLNAKTDELNTIFEGLEAKLAGMKVGVTVWLPELIDAEQTDVGVPDDGVGTDDGFTIGYAKIGGSWRLAARKERWTFTMENPGGGRATKIYGGDAFVISAPVPLVTAPRYIRAGAARLLDDLIQMLGDRIDRFLASVERAKTTAVVK